MRLNELIDWTNGQVKVVETTTGKTIFEGQPFLLTIGELYDLRKWLVGCITVEDGKLFIGVDETVL